MQTKSAEFARLRWADVIRAVGAFLVVLAHVNYSGTGFVRDFYYAVTRAAVPLFFMASGFLLLSKNESIFDFFRKRALKVFIPFVVWSVIYMIWNGESLNQPFITVVKIYALKIIRGPRENHLWFFYELFGLYLFTPILRVYLQKATRKDLYYFCGIWFLLVPALKLIREFTSLQVGFTYYFLAGYIGYFLFGYVAATVNFDVRHKRFAWIIFFLGLIATTAGIYLRGYYALKTQYFEDYLSVNVVVMACALYVAVIDMRVTDAVYRVVLPLSRASFGIYLAHVIVMTEFFSIPPFSALTEVGSTIYMIPLLGLLGFGLSFLLTFILQKTPFLKHIVP